MKEPSRRSERPTLGATSSPSVLRSPALASGFSWSELHVDAARVDVLREAEPTSRGQFVLCWCPFNHALHAAIALGNHLGKPVVYDRALRPDYPHASDRIHALVLDGLEERDRAMHARGIPYWLELPRWPAEHRPRLGELGRRAAVVADWHPTLVVPHHLAMAGKVVDGPLFALDASCIVPVEPTHRRRWSESLGSMTASRWTAGTR
jgi:deoxyribodipyrimidine photo-lyase